MLDGARVVPIAPSPRVRATSSAASSALIELRVKELLPQTTQRAQARLAQLKYLFVTTTTASRYAAQRRAVHEVLERVRLTKLVRNVHATPTETTPSLSSGTLCMPFTCCTALSAAQAPSLVVTGAVDGRLTLWDVTSCTAVATRQGRVCGSTHQGRVLRVAPHPSLPLFFSTALHSRAIAVWRVNTDIDLVAVTGGDAHTCPVRGLAVDPTGHLLASSAGGEGAVCVWDVHTVCTTTNIDPLYRQDGYETVQEVRAVGFHPDGSLLTTGDGEGRVVGWDVRSGKLAFVAGVSPHGGHFGGVRCVAWSGCGIRVASAGEDATVCVWDVRRLCRGTLAGARAETSAPYVLLGHSDVITSVSFYSHPATTLQAPQQEEVEINPVPIGLVTTSLDHTVRVWDADSGLCVCSRDTGAAVYDHCRPTPGPMPGSIVTVGHDKYWALWSCVQNADDVAPVVRDTDLVARANTLTAADSSDEDEMAALRRPAPSPTTSDEDSDDEMAALLRVKRTKA